MKISKIPSLGQFGHYIDGLDFNHITPEEIAEIGKFLKSVSRDFESALTIKRSADFWFSSLAAKRIFLATAEYGTAE